LVVKRTKLDGRVTGPITGNETEDERILLREEKVDVNKRTVAKEAVSVGKRTVTGSETVDAKLKEEKIVVDRDASKKDRR